MSDRYIKVSMSNDMIVSRCINCGVTYGVLADFDEDRRKDKKTFYCPNGHSMSYTESEADRLRRERDSLKQQMARVQEERDRAYQWHAEAAAARAKAERELKRVQQRVHAGVCPCCNRTFTNVARHMKNKHPDVPFVPATKKAARHS